MNSHLPVGSGCFAVVLLLLIATAWTQETAKPSDLLLSVEHFEALLDLKKEERLSASTQVVADFESHLDSFVLSSCFEDRCPNDATLCELLCRALAGVFRIKTDLTKELLSEGTLVSVYGNSVARHALWITRLLNATLKIVRSLEAADSCTCENPVHASQPFVANVFELGLWSLLKRSDLENSSLFPNCAAYNLVAWYQILIPVLANQDSAALRDLFLYVEQCMNGSKSLLTLKTLAYSVAYVQCQSGLSCVMLSEIKSLFAGNLFPLSGVLEPYGLTASFFSQSMCDAPRERIPYALPTCNPCGFLDAVRPDFTNIEQLVIDGGWRQHSSFESTASNAVPSCGLPKIHISQLTRNLFLNVFVKFSIPVVIKGLLTKWSNLRMEFARHSLLKNYGSVDFLGGQIPYGKLFGDVHGYTTMEEFVQYMDEYESSYSQGKPPQHQYPMYLFDPDFLQEYAQEYRLPDDLLVWQNSSVIRQFILGPAGSGAPFHHHCPAFNTVFYGRKSWYLLPPGRAFYSKAHPLNWYSKKQLTNQYVYCSQGPGDTLFVPQGWGHATVNIMETVATAMEIDNGLC